MLEIDLNLNILQLFFWEYLSSIDQVVSEKKMLTDGRAMDAGVTGTLIAHLGAFSSGELIRKPRIPHFFGGV